MCGKRLIKLFRPETNILLSILIATTPSALSGIDHLTIFVELQERQAVGQFLQFIVTRGQDEAIADLLHYGTDESFLLDQFEYVPATQIEPIMLGSRSTKMDKLTK